MSINTIGVFKTSLSIFHKTSTQRVGQGEGDLIHTTDVCRTRSLCRKTRSFLVHVGRSLRETVRGSEIKFQSI